MSAKRQKKQMRPTELVLLESGEGSVPGPGGSPGPSDWLKAKHSTGGQRHAWLVKGSVLDIDRYIGQSHSPDMARKLRVEFAGAHHESR